MQPSSLFFSLVEHFEGLKLEAYKDIAGIWTIGYGTTCYPNGDFVKEGDTCTADEAESYLIDHIQGVVSHMAATIPEDTTQGEFDALCDFVYNVGRGAWDSSSLRVQVNASPRDFFAIALDFQKWDKAHVNGELVEVEGLLRRRRCEAYLFQHEANEPTFYEAVA